MVTEMLNRLRSEDAKVNLVPWRDSSRIGMRGNWSKLFSGLGLLALGGTVRELNAQDILGESFGIGVGLFAGFILVCLVAWGSSETDKTGSVLLFTLAVMVVVCFASLMYVFFSRDDFMQVLGGGVVMLMVFLLLAANVLTTWWPPYGFPTRNFGED